MKKLFLKDACWMAMVLHPSSSIDLSKYEPSSENHQNGFAMRGIKLSDYNQDPINTILELEIK